MAYYFRQIGLIYPQYPACNQLVGGWTNPVEKYAQVKLDHLLR